MSVGRRGFLGLLAAAPVAGPVMAREAAQKAGIGSVGSYGAMESARDMCMPSSSSSGDDKGWAERSVKRVFDQAWLKEKREWFTIHRNVGALDPDLASSRSFSLSTAVRLQREREYQRFVVREQEEAKQSFLKAFGFEFRP